MPFTRKTPRRPSRHLITLAQLTDPNWQVIGEMERLGLWSGALDDVDVCLVPVSFVCYGWYRNHIYIPAVTTAQLSDLVTGHHTRLTDVLRHEWAHALADCCPELVGNTRFTRTFGGRCEFTRPVRGHDPRHHLTRYAASMPCEDFAETFHHYLRHKGRLPLRLHDKPAIVRKWEFVGWMAREIDRRG
jgi:hypothetical protein